MIVKLKHLREQETAPYVRFGTHHGRLYSTAKAWILGSPSTPDQNQIAYEYSVL